MNSLVNRINERTDSEHAEEKRKYEEHVIVQRGDEISRGERGGREIGAIEDLFQIREHARP